MTGQAQVLRAVSPADVQTPCAHCGTPTVSLERPAFCCVGCRAVHALLLGHGLDRYYALARRLVPVSAATLPSERAWVDALIEETRSNPESHALRAVTLDVQGMQCSACVWLIEELFRRTGGNGDITINSSRGTAVLRVPAAFDWDGFLSRVEPFGYRFSAASSDSPRADTGALIRMGVTIALALNAMAFAAADYFGLTQGRVHSVMRILTFAIAATSVLVGGGEFIRSAVRALREGIVHVDATIAVGLVLAFASASTAFILRGDASYLDTLTVFVALMQVGRYLQTRVLESNRQQLLADPSADSILVRRREGAHVKVVTAKDVGVGDLLVVAPSDLVPVACELIEPAAAVVSLEWINGESAAVPAVGGNLIQAGAHNRSTTALLVRAKETFSGSLVRELLLSRASRDPHGARSTAGWQRFATIYVVAVTAIGAVGLIAWYVATRDLALATHVATSVLVLACPCALGIAIPLAYDLAHAGLRRAGMFVQSPGLLDRIPAVRKLAFDKTGTLTRASLAADRAAFDRLSPVERALLYNLVARSSHPKARAVLECIGSFGNTGAFDSTGDSDLRDARHVSLAFSDAMAPREVPSKGIEAVLDGCCYRVGAPSWAAAHAGAPENIDVVFARDGQVLLAFSTREELRSDAVHELRALAQSGRSVTILSGDSEDRVAEVARSVGVSGRSAHARLSPEDKLEWVRANDRQDTLFIGDGLNDLPALAASFAAGTPVIDRPFVAARSDFYLTTEGLRPVSLLFAVSATLRNVVRRNVALALVYNAITIAAALAGLMKPWMVAVLMPLSSLVVIASTTSSLSSGARIWKS